MQAQTPPEERRSAEPVRPPAAKTPEMTVPMPEREAGEGRADADGQAGARRGARPDADARRARRAPGSAVAETGARGQGFGLSTGGGAGSGSTLDVADFCCPDYIAIDGRAHPQRTGTQSQRRAGRRIVKFTIQRDGTLTDVELERSSGYPTLDLAALRARADDATAAAAARRVSRIRR